MLDPTRQLREGDALLVVDLQRDFCPGGRLAVEGGDDVVPVINAWIAAARHKGLPIFASRDFHPPGHVSFKDQGGRWPVHCIQNTPGAAFHPDLQLPDDAPIITKGDHAEFDQYSAFDRTGLAESLRRRGVKRLWIGGLAQGVCVKASAVDAEEAGFDARVIMDATRPVDPERGHLAVEDMRDAGVTLVGDRA